MRATKGLLSGCIFWACLSPAQAETSSEYARLGQKVWAAFMCSIAAEQMEDKEAQARLFLIGYESGKSFYEAAATGKIEGKDAVSILPTGIFLRLQGPNADFVLGRIWEAVGDEYHARFREECPTCSSSEDLTKMKARTRFGEMNCDLVE